MQLCLFYKKWYCIGIMSETPLPPESQSESESQSQSQSQKQFDQDIDVALEIANTPTINDHFADDKAMKSQLPERVRTESKTGTQPQIDPSYKSAINRAAGLVLGATLVAGPIAYGVVKGAEVLDESIQNNQETNRELAEEQLEIERKLQQDNLIEITIPEQEK